MPWQRLLAEFAVIVGSVLIALAVDSWWERHEERNQAEAYLQQLLVDFQGTERRLRATIEEDTKRLELVNSVISRGLRGPLPPPDSLELPTGYHQFEPLTGTVTALVQGGDLRLLRSDSIRFALLAFSSAVNSTETMLRHTETMIWNSTQRVILGRARHVQFPRRAAAIAGQDWGEVDVAGALSDPEIISALEVQSVATQIRLFNLNRLEKPTSRLIRLIQAELN